MPQNPRLPTIKSTASHPIIAFSIKEDGNMSSAAIKQIDVVNARRVFLDKVGLSNTTLRLIHPTHSPNFVVLNETESGISQKLYRKSPVITTDLDSYRDGSDGILTFKPDIAIGLMPADCVPLIVWSSSSSFHGIIHIGLLGALNDIVRSLSVVYRDYGIDITSTYYYLGPSILVSDYNVSKSHLWSSIRTQALQSVPQIKKFIDHRGEEEFFDVRGMIYSQLQSIGVPLGNIDSYGISTADPASLFFSNYIDRPLGLKRRFMSAVGYANCLRENISD